MEWTRNEEGNLFIHVQEDESDLGNSGIEK